MTYSADCLANIRLRKSIDGKGFSGVSTAEFSCDIYTGDYHAEGETVVFSGCGLSVFYAAECGYSGGVLSITAYDLCKNLDIPFDYSGYEQFNDDKTGKYYDTTMIVAAIANQCGFSEGGYSGRVQQTFRGSHAGTYSTIFQRLMLVSGRTAAVYLLLYRSFLLLRELMFPMWGAGRR